MDRRRYGQLIRSSFYGVYVFLASDMSSYDTVAVPPVDGAARS